MKNPTPITPLKFAAAVEDCLAIEGIKIISFRRSIVQGEKMIELIAAKDEAITSISIEWDRFERMYNPVSLIVDTANSIVARMKATSDSFPHSPVTRLYSWLNESFLRASLPFANKPKSAPEHPPATPPEQRTNTRP